MAVPSDLAQAWTRGCQDAWPVCAHSLELPGEEPSLSLSSWPRRQGGFCGQEVWDSPAQAVIKLRTADMQFLILLSPPSINPSFSRAVLSSSPISPPTPNYFFFTWLSLTTSAPSLVSLVPGWCCPRLVFLDVPTCACLPLQGPTPRGILCSYLWLLLTSHLLNHLQNPALICNFPHHICPYLSGPAISHVLSRSFPRPVQSP